MGMGNSYWQGVSMGAGLIIAIGAQNAFVLTQSIRRNHALAVAATCALIDIVLIFTGVWGIGALVARNAVLKAIAALGGAAFLFWFGARSLAAVFQCQALAANSQNATATSFGPTFVATLAVSLLNPHVYLDTVVMLGAISGNYPGNGRHFFGAGAATASVLWFFSLYIAGKRLAPVFKNPKAWQYLNGFVCLLVWWIAVTLVYGYFRPQ